MQFAKCFFTVGGYTSRNRSIKDGVLYPVGIQIREMISQVIMKTEPNQKLYNLFSVELNNEECWT